MTAVPEALVDLSLAPGERWSLEPLARERAAEISRVYVEDLGGLDNFAGMLDLVASVVRPDYALEIEEIARQVDCTQHEALLTNLYYDAVKMALACTAFAIDTGEGPLLARNLDWWTEKGMLRDYTQLTRFAGAPAGDFASVGWPGFAGALSAIAPGRFAVTLNAVLSDDDPALATPISLFLRTVCEEARGYEEAVDMLCLEPIATDCLLLVTGTRSGEMVVVERTPTRHAVRGPQDGVLVVANEYVALGAARTSEIPEPLRASSRGRSLCAAERALAERPATAEACFDILSDSRVRMEMTVQQMVFGARTGQLEIRLPEGFK